MEFMMHISAPKEGATEIIAEKLKALNIKYSVDEKGIVVSSKDFGYAENIAKGVNIVR